MKITIDARLLGRGGQSGIEEYTRNIVRELISRAPQDDFRIFYNGLRPAPAPAEWLAAANTRVVNWRVPNRALNLAFLLAGKPAIAEAHSVVFSPNIDLVATGQAAHVMTFHDLSFLHHPYFFSYKQRMWHALQRYKAQASRATKIIAVSEFTKYDLVNLLGIPAEKIQVIYSGIDRSFKPLPKQTEVQQKFRETHKLNFPVLLYLGTLEPRKNIPAIIAAFNLLKTRPQCRDLRLVLGGANGWLYRDITTAIDRSPHQAHIIQWGFVRPEDKLFLYNESRAFVYPSFFEGFGFPPLEAQACGAPVVASDRTSLPEVLGSSALLVNPWKTGDLADALEAALTDSPAREKLIREGLQNAGRFTWEKTAQETISLLHGIKPTA